MIDSNTYGHAGFRPLFVDGGPALLRFINRFLPLDDKNSEAVLTAYEPAQLEPLLETNANIFLLLFDQGLAPDETEEDAETFRKAADYLHGQGVEAWASIAAGHCDSRGAFSSQSWFALARGKKRVPSFVPGMAMTCWLDPEWRKHVSGRIRAAVECGADGIWLHPLIFGAAPAVFGPHILGPVGCSCARCRDAFQKDAGAGKLQKFPPSPQQNPDLFHEYIDWRCRGVEQAVAEWRQEAQALSPNLPMACVATHPVHCDSGLLFGADPVAISQKSDVLIAETNNLVNFEKKGLTYDAATVGVLREYVEDCTLAGAPRAAGPRIEFPPHAVIWRSAMGDAVSCGAPTALRATAFFDEKTLDAMTLDDELFETLRRSQGAFWNWIDRNIELFEAVRPHSQIALVHSFRAMRRDHAFSVDFFKIFATFTELHVPFRVLPLHRLDHELPGDFQIIIMPRGVEPDEKTRQKLVDFGRQGTLLFVGRPPEWAHNVQSIGQDIFKEPLPGIVKNPLWRNWINRRHSGTPAPWFQHIFPASGPVARRLNRPGRFIIPEQWKTLFDKIADLRQQHGAKLDIQGPPYIHVREFHGQGNMLLHIVNLLTGFPGQSVVRISFPEAVSTRIITPDRNRIVYTSEKTISLEIKTYAVIEIKL